MDNRCAGFLVGRYALLLAAGLMVLQHAVLLFRLDTPALLAAVLVWDLAALAMLAGPYGRRERWAWYASGMLPLGIVGTAAVAPDFAPGYYALAAVCVAGLVLSMPDFGTAPGRD